MLIPNMILKIVICIYSRASILLELDNCMFVCLFVCSPRDCM